MKIQHRSFRGGYKFNNFKGQPSEKLIKINIPEKVIIPLKQGSGCEVPPVVKVGDIVKAGQIIGIDNDSISNPVHSSVNGSVEKIEEISLFGNKINTVTIKADKTDQIQLLDGRTPEWKKLSSQKIEEMLYKSGVASLDRNGIPTRYKSSNLMPDDVKHIIIHEAQSEVFNISLSLLLSEENIPHFIQGLKILNKIFPKAKIHFAINKCHKKLIKKIAGMMTDNSWIKFYTLESKYPQDYDEILIPAILNKSFPYGYSSGHIGVTVLSIQTILHIYDAVVEGKPLIEKTIALCGNGFESPLHISARIGTSLDHILINRIKKDKEIRYILNSPLTGTSISNLSLPVDRSIDKIIALPENRKRQFMAFANPGFTKDAYSRTVLSPLSGLFGLKKQADTNLYGEKRSCLFCSFCMDVCPARIIPHHIYRYVNRKIIDETIVNYKIFNCIECNLCSYVCTAKIPVAKYIKQGKEKLTEMGLAPSSKKDQKPENSKENGAENK